MQRSMRRKRGGRQLKKTTAPRRNPDLHELTPERNNKWTDMLLQTLSLNLAVADLGVNDEG